MTLKIEYTSLPKNVTDFKVFRCVVPLHSSFAVSGSKAKQRFHLNNTIRFNVSSIGLSSAFLKI
jgi:hypothetical protein